MPSPVVSIITPTYNHGKYIKQCIQSVQKQSFEDWEMIIINDGSTDQTQIIAEEAAVADPRIKVLSQENVGVFKLGETYNKALSVSRGKYIAVLEGDDIWHPYKLEKQVYALDADESCVLAWARADLVDADLTPINDTRPQILPAYESLYLNDPTGSIIELLSMRQFIPALTLLIRRDKLIETGGFIQSHGMPLVDFPTVLNLSLHGKFCFNKEILGMWRIYPTQTTKKYTVQIHNGFKLFVSELLPKIKEMSEIKKREIMAYYDKLCLIAYARSGRYKLIRKEYKSARKDYIKAITYPVGGKWTWRLRSAIGYTMSLLHLDVEWMARLLGKKTYQQSSKG